MRSRIAAVVMTVSLVGLAPNVVAVSPVSGEPSPRPVVAPSERAKAPAPLRGVLPASDVPAGETILRITPSSSQAGAMSEPSCSVSQTPCSGALEVQTATGPLAVGTVTVAGTYRVAEDTLDVTVTFTSTSGREMLFTGIEWALCDNPPGAPCDCSELLYPVDQRATHASPGGVTVDSFEFAVNDLPPCGVGEECWCLCVKAKAVLDPGFNPATLPETATIRLADGGNTSYFTATVTNGGILDSPPGNPYPAWCVDTDRSINLNTDYGVYVYSSYDPNLPGDPLDPPPTPPFYGNLDRVNWILNTVAAGADVNGLPCLAGDPLCTVCPAPTVNDCDIQRAIWALVDNTPYTCGGENQCRWQRIVSAANASGDGFVPDSCAQKVAVVLLPWDTERQMLIAQVTALQLSGECEQACTHVRCCTSGFEQQNQTIVVRKVASPQSDEEFAFTGTGPNDFTFGGGFSLVDDGEIGPPYEEVSFSGIVAGQYLLSEVVPEGWTLADIVCDDGVVAGTDSLVDPANAVATINLDPGETVVCTYYNTAVPARAQVRKVSVPAGFEAGWEFRLLRDGELVETVTTSGTDHVEFTSGLTAGSYTIVETAQDGWDSDGGSEECSFTVTLPADSSRVFSCTFTNTKKATLIVKKMMLGADSSFTFTGTGPQGTIATNGGTLELQVPPGQYTSTEGALPAQWRLQSIACDDADSTGDLASQTATFNAAAGEVVTCTFTNIAPGTVKIRKLTVGGDGTFAFHPSEGSDFTLSHGGEMTLGPLPPVAQWVTETVPDGWALTEITCDNPSGVGNLAEKRAEVQLRPGTTVTCTFTNTLQRGSLTVTTVVNWPKKPAQIALSFTICISGPSYPTTPSCQVARTNNGLTLNWGQLIPGSYTVTENDPGASWAVEIAGSPAVVPPGGDASVTVTNNRRAKLTVKKRTRNGFGSFEYTTTNLPEASFMLTTTSPDGTSPNKVFGNLVPGQTYAVTEVGPTSGWSFTSLECNTSNATVTGQTASIVPAPGDSIVCTWVNTFSP